MSDKDCDAKVWDASGWHRHRCTRRGVEWVGVGYYCKQHAAIARRRRERDTLRRSAQARRDSAEVFGD